jgi:hypothetical protein
VDDNLVVAKGAYAQEESGVNDNAIYDDDEEEEKPKKDNDDDENGKEIANRIILICILAHYNKF